MFDKESFKKYISAGSSNPIYYFKRRRSSYELPSLHWGRKVRPGVPKRKKVPELIRHFLRVDSIIPKNVFRNSILLPNRICPVRLRIE